MAADQIEQDTINRYKKPALATIYSGLQRMGYEYCFMEGLKSFTPGVRMVGRARTLRYLPPRPDMLGSSAGEDAPEYRAMSLCGPGDVLVADAMGRRRHAIGGDMILLQLKMVGAEGVVTDGGIRDMAAVVEYGYGVFAGGATPAARWPHLGSYDANVDVQCGGILVRPGDLIVADDEGIVCVPKQHASEVIEWVEEHEQDEEVVKKMILRDNVVPGKYYNTEMFEKLIEERNASKPSN